MEISDLVRRLDQAQRIDALTAEQEQELVGDDRCCCGNLRTEPLEPGAGYWRPISSVRWKRSGGWRGWIAWAD
ncbi:hypothetical protein UMZ34_15400 [Halopseudomonas pachastrellae]|nr:hypothetical protein UMZ34_15400 [Halopseudomonas pachastrellae]